MHRLSDAREAELCHENSHEVHIPMERQHQHFEVSYFSAQSQESRRLLRMYLEKMQRREYHFQSEWVSPPARLIFRSICGQQVSVAIAARARLRAFSPD